MALIKCSECGKEISDKASECPKCGCPINKRNKKINNNIKLLKGKIKKNKKVMGIILLAILVIIFILIILLIIFNNKYKLDGTFIYSDYKSGTYGHNRQEIYTLNKDGTCSYRIYAKFNSGYPNTTDVTFQCEYKINKSKETIEITYTDSTSEDKQGYVIFKEDTLKSIYFDDKPDKVYVRSYNTK